MKEIFNEIYEKNKWNGGSGPGSFPENIKEYMGFLERFIQDKKINSVMDAGCGDWQFSRFIDWGSADYHGVDVVDSVVKANIDNFTKDNVKFTLYDGNPDSLPNADLLIIKDVLQHLSFATILKFVENFNKFTHCLVTNCVNPRGKTINKDIKNGERTDLDLRLKPFYLDAREVLSFRCPPNHKKLTLLLDNIK